MKKYFKWLFIGIFGLIVLAEAALFITGNLYVNKVVYMTLLSGKSGPDIDELKLFKSHIIKSGAPQPWPISSRFGQQKLSDLELQAISEYKTVSFLVIQHDSLLFEQHWEGYNNASYVNSFSMAKSIHAILIGCAIRDGFIQSIDQHVSDFIPAFVGNGKEKITLRHLLTMSSGIDFKEEYASPLAWPAEAYYGPDVNALTLNAEVVEEPGKTWYYKGGDSQLLGIVLKQVLKGKSIADYAAEKLWQPIGAEHEAYWSTDEKEMEKVSCCFYTNARDYARIAKLYMHQGAWNDQQIVDTAFVSESLQAAPLIDRNGKPNDKYGFQWWLMKHKGHSIFYMRGIRGQYVFAIPDLNLILVRLGHKRAAKKGDDLPGDIFVYLDVAMRLAKEGK